MNEEFELFKSHVSVGRLRISNFSGVIFLCGGKMTKPPARVESARDHFYRKIREAHPGLHERIFLAETINEWFSDMLRERYFPDLLTFEKHLSGFASAICLIVESPGSIAELGAFSVIEEFADRLMVAIRRQYQTEGSFISLGPIEYLKRNHPDRDRIFVYPWNLVWDPEQEKNFPVESDLDAICDAFISDLIKFETGNPRSAKFNPKVEGHVSLLISDIVDLFSALKLREIKEILDSAGIECSETQIKIHLFVLEKLGFVRKYEYRSVGYFVSLKDSIFIEYNLASPPPELVDRGRFKVTLNANYKKTDESRLLAVRWAREESD